MGLATCAAFFSIFVQFSSIKTVISFNLDTDYAVIKKGPPGSFFGFAVAEHQVTYGGVVEQWYEFLITVFKIPIILVKTC